MKSVAATLVIIVVLCEAEAELFVGSARYAAESTVLVNDVQRRDRELGYKIKAELSVAPVWREHHSLEFLLKFQLHQPKLYLKGKHVNAEFLPHKSTLDLYVESTFYVHLKNGLIHMAYLDPEDLPDVHNYKKSLISLFQFQTNPGEHNETDISGDCHILYETLSQNVFRKIKRSCDTDGDHVRARRVTRYTVAGTALSDVHAEEVLTIGHDQLGLKARCWVTLRALDTPPAPAPLTHSDLAGALRDIPAALQPSRLLLQSVSRERFIDYESAEAAVEQNEAALVGEEAGGGGGAPAALAALQLLPALRAAQLPALRELLRRDHLLHLLPGLCRAFGLAGTSTALRAVDELVQLRAEDPVLPHALLYLEGFALTDAPHPEAVAEVLRIGERARAPGVAEAALLAAGAAAARSEDAIADAVREALVRALVACASEECRRVRLLALGNMRREDTAHLLLEQAEREGSSGARVAALQALSHLPLTLDHAKLNRVSHLALHQAVPLEVRATALELVVQSRAEWPETLVSVAWELHVRGPHELRRIFWQRLKSLGSRHLVVRRLLAALGPELRGWDAQAHAGTSAVFERVLGWAAGGWTAALDSVQLAEAGVLRRGLMRLTADGPGNTTADILGVEVWTRGIESLTGGQGGATSTTPDREEGMAGGLALSVAGTRMRDITLFNGQAELLGHVWAGTGSTPTPAVRALQVQASAGGEMPLLAGVAIRPRWRTALALALDGHAQVSLWWRTARCQLELRVGVAALAEASLGAEWATVRARAVLTAEPRLRVASDVDFYDTVSLCVRVATDDHELARNMSLWSAAGGRRVRRRREERTGAGGRTLSLGAPNDRMCRSLRAADDDVE